MLDDLDLSRLPTVYRIALMLCDLEGLSRQEAAGRRGCREGTLSGRLSCARRLLARRLAHHGFADSAGVLAAMLANRVSASAAEALNSATVKAATEPAGQAVTIGMVSVEVAALVERVMQAMRTIRRKVVTIVVLAASLAVLGGGLLLCRVKQVAIVAPAQASGPITPRPGERALAPPLETSGPARGALPPVKLVNKAEVKIDFEVARVGPSGLGTIDVYVTTNDGTTWEKSAPPADVALPNEKHAGPASGTVTLSLPKEGMIYGFYLVVKSGTGLGKPGPRHHEPPQVRIERDTTVPMAELYSPQPAADWPNSLVLTWKAEDRNLAANPVSLEWAANAEGPWMFIGDAQLPNTGKYTWTLPAHVPAKVYLRLTVRDNAGNVAVAATDSPVVIDLVVPGDVAIKGTR